MLKVSYDIKPLPSNIRRVRLNVIDSFINRELIELEDHKTKFLINSFISKNKHLKNKYEKKEKELQEQLEKKRLFQIKLKAILSFRNPDSIKFIKELNDFNKDLRFDLLSSIL